MPSLVPQFIAITFAAAVVNGALGYGFSSITVPLALLLTTSRTLNPSLVLVELALNGYMLLVNREALPAVRPRMTPMAIGLVPGVVAGTLAVALVHPEWLKLVTFSLLLPLILLQAGGLRRPLRSERRWALPFGAGLGALYSLTTISGPPLAVFLNNQGLDRREFRAALGFIRLAEAVLAAIAYWYAGLFTPEAMALAPIMIPGLLVGVPTGAWISRRIDAETFRRVCMSFDAWIVGFGITTVLRRLQVVDAPEAYAVLAAVAVADAALLYRFFTQRAARRREALPC